MSKTIAVIGATGAQGLPVVKHLLASCGDGSPSPWKVRALTRSPDHERAKELESLGAEIIQGMLRSLLQLSRNIARSTFLISRNYLGSFLDPATIHELFKGAYGAFVNTDGFAVGAAVETNSAFVIVRLSFLHVRSIVQHKSHAVGDRSLPQASSLYLVKS